MQNVTKLDGPKPVQPVALKQTGFGLKTASNDKNVAASRVHAKSKAIPKTMKALVVPRPGATLELQTLSVPTPKKGEVLVQVAASPINPSDLLMLSGDYGESRSYPFVPGLEGSGTVVAHGGGLLARSIMGKRVACAPESDGLWSEYAVVPANRCVPLPKGISAGAGAMSFVNPLAAIALIDEAKRGGHRAVISTAAGGALGRMIRARAAMQGIEVVDIVRRKDQADALHGSGAQYVLSSDRPTFRAELQSISQKLGCTMAFDAIAGEMTGHLAEALSQGGEILIYGELSGQPSQFDPATMTFKGLTVRGFWLTEWSKQKSFLQQLFLTRDIMKALEGGFAETSVATRLPLQDALAAPDIYAQNMSAGKVLIVAN